jgi:hypothetical protein
MTRINTVDPRVLTSKHLVAEYRELPRIFGLAAAAFQRGELPTDPRNPTTYCLGAGHVRFFYNKLAFLTDRFRAIVLEMQSRGFHPQYTNPPVAGPGSIVWYGHWTPSPADHSVNLRRLVERAPEHEEYKRILTAMELTNG